MNGGEWLAVGMIFVGAVVIPAILGILEAMSPESQERSRMKKEMLKIRTRNQVDKYLNGEIRWEDIGK